jgi:hypothetical protein
MSTSEYFRAVVENPEDDAARLDYARALGDVPWARFIEAQVTRVARQRLRNESSRSIASVVERQLHDAESAAIARQVMKYTGYPPDPHRENRYEFHRGFIARVSVDQDSFLEHGAHLFKLAPLRGLTFRCPQPTEPRRLLEILASPLLRRLDHVGFPAWRLTTDEQLAVLNAENLGRCLSLNLTGSTLPWASRAEWQGAPVLRQILTFRGEEYLARFYTSSRAEPRANQYIGDTVRTYHPTPASGRDLEAELGYLPWIHVRDNGVNTWDLRYFHDKGLLPARPAGAPVDYAKDPADGNPDDPDAVGPVTWVDR